MDELSDVFKTIQKWKSGEEMDIYDDDIKNGYNIIYEKYCKKWVLNGVIHRSGGPAVEFTNGTKQWYEY